MLPIRMKKAIPGLGYLHCHYRSPWVKGVFVKNDHASSLPLLFVRFKSHQLPVLN